MKVILIFRRNFLNSKSDMFEKQYIINLSIKGSESNASFVLNDSDVTFLAKG